ncbi:hypothetical protein [Rhizobium leguminosarum]|uniref:hypothetical protein n=1 Tax=Rhizobium leguminosarum TaxID=384 RepID=UPI0004B0961D|nr:hypothetical protein [Rhizobium leguminosarum]
MDIVRMRDWGGKVSLPAFDEGTDADAQGSAERDPDHQVIKDHFSDGRANADPYGGAQNQWHTAIH